MDLSLSSSGPGMMAYYTDEEDWDSSSSPMKGDRKLPQEVIEILEDLSRYPHFFILRLLLQSFYLQSSRGRIRIN